MADTTWTPIDDPTAFQDDAVFEIDKTTKSIQVLVEQPIVAGENKSQFIKFQMGRYYDAIDLTQMEVNILYESPTGYQDISSAVNREYSDEYIRFGWLVPYAACPEKGTLSFAVEFVGADYVLKTTRGSTPVLDSISGSSSVPEPVEQTWYIELQSQVASTLQTASDALEKSQQIINALATPQNASLASEMSDTSAVYVYTGSESGYTYGNWYYYDGTEWVSGGQYVSTDYLIDSTLTQSGQAADAWETGDRIDSLIEKTFAHVNGSIDTPTIVSGSWASGGAAVGGNRGRTEKLLKFKGSLSFGLGNYTKYKYGYIIYTSPDLTQYTNSGWVTADVTNLDFTAYAIGFSFAHLSGSGAIPDSELAEIQSLFSISGDGYLFSLRDEIWTLQKNIEAVESNPLSQIGANPFRFKGCYDHLFVNSKTDAVIPHESLYHARISKKFGFDVIEANVSATSDGVYVVNHLENYKFGGYFHHVDGTTDISDILLSSVTWDWVVANVRYNSTIPKYHTRPCRLEEFLQECRQQGLIPFITSSDTNVIAIADAYMGKDNYIAYGASRTDCPNAIIYHYVSNLTTKEDILAYCENIGKPFIFGLGNVESFTDAGLKELVAELHENGYMIGIAYSDNNWHKYAAYGFDVNATIRHINRIEKGNLCNLDSIFDFSGFEYTNATLSNGVLTFSSAGTIKPKIENTSYSLCGFDIEFDMTGTVTIPAVGEQKSSYNLTSDGSYPVFCVTPIINGSPAITINVASGTVIRDVFFKASVF